MEGNETRWVLGRIIHSLALVVKVLHFPTFRINCAVATHIEPLISAGLIDHPASESYNSSRTTLTVQQACRVKDRYNPVTNRSAKDLDDLDKNIILMLRVDGRETAMGLSRQLGVNEGTIRKRIRRLVTNGIMRIIAVTDPYKIGYSIDTFIGLKVDSDKIIDISSQLAQMKEVRYVGVAAGTYDIIIAAIFRSTQELSDFLTEHLRSVEGVRRIEMSHILKVTKRTYDWMKSDD